MNRHLTASLAVLATLFACTPQGAPTYENLVIVLVDTLRIDHLSGYGYARETAPYLSQLGREGIQMEGYSASSWTKPSVATALTGLHPQAHQTIERTDSLPVGVPYLPELLQDAGFETAAFVANLNVGRKLGFGRGFDHYDQARGSAKIDATKVNRRAGALIEELEPPFFLYMHYVDPHDPYEPQRAWNEESEAGPRIQPRQLLRSRTPITAEIVSSMIDQYDAEILETDRAIEDLMQTLDSKGLLDDTLVVVTSDHGEEFFEHGRLMHGRSLYQEVLRVPFQLWARQHRMRLPEQKRFHHIDLLPTLLSALGQPPAQGRVTGESRWGELHGGRAEDNQDRPLFFHLDLDGVGALALLEDNTKLIHENRTPPLRLYDLGADPSESAPAQAAAEISLQSTPLLRRLLRHHNDQATLKAARQVEELDQETLAALATLGYIETGSKAPARNDRAIPERLGASGIPRRAPPPEGGAADGSDADAPEL